MTEIAAKPSIKSAASTELPYGQEPFRGGSTSNAPSAATSTQPSEIASQSSSKVVPLHGTATAAFGTGAKSPGLSEKHAAALEARGIDPEIAVRYGLFTVPGKFAGKDGLAIPFVRDGRVINHEYRGPGKQFQQDTGAPRSFWNEDCLRDPTISRLPLMITEGPLDALSMVHVHQKTVSVPNGAGSNLDFLVDLMPLLSEVPRIILAGDGDEPGRKLNAELARRFGAARCSWISYPDGCKDANDVLKLHGQQGLLDLIKGAKPYPIKGLFKLSDYPDVGEPETFDTGWMSLNTHLRLWVPEFMVVTGVPSHGKSTWALNLMAQMADRHQHRVAVLSREMPIVPYVRDVLRKFKGTPNAEADAWIEEYFHFLDEDPREIEQELTLDWVLEKASDAVIRYGVRWLLIDPWNQVEHRRARESTEEYQERSIRSLRRFAKSFGCGVIVVTHPTKDVKDPKTGKTRPPSLYDIAGSSHWYNAADHGVVIERPDMKSSEIKVNVQKSRFRAGGVSGEVWLRYEVARGRFVPVLDRVEEFG